MAATTDIPLERLRTVVRDLREHAGGASAVEVERAINDVYAAVLAREAVRTRLRRRMQESLGEALDVAALRDCASALESVEREVSTLRGLLRELRALPVEPVRPAG